MDMTKARDAATYLRRCARKCADGSVERLRFDQIADLLSPPDKDVLAAVAGVRAGLGLDKPFVYHCWDNKQCRWCRCSAHDMETATKACQGLEREKA